MRTLMFITVTIALLCSLVHTAMAETAYYMHSPQQGYYWRNEPPPPPPEEEDTKRVEPPKQEKLSIDNYTEQQLYRLHPTQYDALIMATHENMTASPTPENSEKFMRLLDIARRRALGVANLVKFTIMKNPQYNLERDIPIAQGAQVVKTRLEGQEQANKIRSSRRDFGLVYFYSTTCSYCVEQSGVVDIFAKRSGWEIEEVDVNTRPALAAKFNIQTTPTIVLIRRGVKDFLTLSVGVATLRELEERVYQAIRYLNGEVKPTELTLRESQEGGSHDIYKPLRR